MSKIKWKKYERDLADNCRNFSRQGTKTQRKDISFEPLSEKEEFIAEGIVDAAYTVHKKIGPGLLEEACEVCFWHGLSKRGFSYKRQIDVPIVYDGISFDEGLRLDVLIEDLIIYGLKAVETINPVWEARLLSHLKLTNKRPGFLINFNV